ncbi:MAG: hypothetical protein M1823_002378 [Watsoniomyces obsoletus]|nr:MAG: hypothetical protein M1823_002378 [Watsoniomyces obsoletus]
MSSFQDASRSSDTTPTRYPPDSVSLPFARRKDLENPLRHFRSQFSIPTRGSLTRTNLESSITHNPDDSNNNNNEDEPCIYLCGNSLGLKPKCVDEYLQAHLSTWSAKGVTGHFSTFSDSPLPPFVELDRVAASEMAKLVGANPDEVAVMGSLTSNLHLLMASFYRPARNRKGRYKIILEGKAFPSDHYAIESQIQHWGLDPEEAMVLIEPDDGGGVLISTQHIYDVIDHHAETTALLLLPGVQFYTGQYFDIPNITTYAQQRGIIVGWDLAHTVGNLPIRLHDWEVDFAVWCNYKYVNAGPGVIGGVFIHEKHGRVETEKDNNENDTQEEGDDKLKRNGVMEKIKYRPRLTGWWGTDRSTRFDMSNHFIPIPGAAGYQLSNPSATDLAVLMASLSVFNQTDMTTLRKQSMELTGYLYHLLTPSSGGQLDPGMDGDHDTGGKDREEEKKRIEERIKDSFEILTPSSPMERGAQLSIKVHPPALLPIIMRELSERGIIVDHRNPDVIRVSPVPLYNSFEDVWRFVMEFKEAVGRGLREVDGR